jgi:hypothetical protein
MFDRFNNRTNVGNFVSGCKEFRTFFLHLLSWGRYLVWGILDFISGYQPFCTIYQPFSSGYQPFWCGYQPFSPGYQPFRPGYQPFSRVINFRHTIPLPTRILCHMLSDQPKKKKLSIKGELLNKLISLRNQILLLHLVRG